MRYREWAVKTNFQKSYSFAASAEFLDCLLGGFTARAHHYQYLLGVRIAYVLEQLVLTSGERREPLHRFLNNSRCL